MCVCLLLITKSHAPVPISETLIKVFFQTVQIDLVAGSIAVITPCLQSNLQAFLLADGVPSIAILITDNSSWCAKCFILLLSHAYSLLIPAGLNALVRLPYISEV